MTYSFHSLLKDDAFRDKVKLLAEQYKSKIDLDGLFSAVGITSVVRKTLSNGLGISTKTDYTCSFPIAQKGAAMCISIAAVQQAITIQEILEDENKEVYLVVGSVPATWSNWKGMVFMEISPYGTGSTIKIRVVYEGQSYDWGAGKRLSRRIERHCIDIADYIKRGNLRETTSWVDLEIKSLKK